VPQRNGLSWITDVVSLLRKRDAQAVAIDWTLIRRSAVDAGAALPMYVTCQYLATTFNAAIPKEVIDELRRAASSASPLQHLAALDGLRCEARSRRIKSLVQASGWRSRAVIARAMLLPPPAYFKMRNPELHTPALALLYLTRPLRFIARQLRRRYRRLYQASTDSKLAPTPLAPQCGGAMT